MFFDAIVKKLLVSVVVMKSYSISVFLKALKGAINNTREEFCSDSKKIQTLDDMNVFLESKIDTTLLCCQQR